MSIVPYHPPAPRTFSWSIPAAIQLIRERRNAHHVFLTSRNHTAAWNLIATNIFTTIGFACTSDQCRSKWNSLKRGFENLLRIYGDNPEDFPLDSPNTFDHACFTEMSDQFWAPNSNYFYI